MNKLIIFAILLCAGCAPAAPLEGNADLYLEDGTPCYWRDVTRRLYCYREEPDE